MADEEKIPSMQSEAELLGLTPTPTADSSKNIREWPERIKEQALFSARTTSKTYLDAVRRALAGIAARNVIPRVAESSLRNILTSLGYRPETGFPDNNGRVPPATPGSITDLSSSRRIQLIVDTNVKQARSMAQLASSQNPVFMMTNPAWKLTRTGARKKPRGDWRGRWKAAGDSVGWRGAVRTQMMALKDSPIWAALGRGVGGYSDTLNSAFPPFAFGSGMAWVNASRREWQRACAAEGVPDGLEELTDKIKSAQSAAASRGTQTPIAKPGNQPRVMATDRAEALANEAVARAVAEIELARSEMRGYRVRIDRAKTEALRRTDGAAWVSTAVQLADTTISRLDKDIAAIGQANERLDDMKVRIKAANGNADALAALRKAADGVRSVAAKARRSLASAAKSVLAAIER